MTLTTRLNVRITSSEWTELSSAETQSLTVADGQTGIIFASTKPSSDIRAGHMGHVLNTGDTLTCTIGGTSWGRAEDVSRSARISICESVVSEIPLSISADSTDYRADSTAITADMAEAV